MDVLGSVFGAGRAHSHGRLFVLKEGTFESLNITDVADFLTWPFICAFSQKCEEIANMLRSLDLNTAAEGSMVQGFTLQTVARLSPNDAVLPQVLTVCEMVKRGVGVVSWVQFLSNDLIEEIVSVPFLVLCSIMGASCLF